MMEFWKQRVNQLRRTQRVLAIVIVALGALTGANTGMSLLNSDDGAESTEVNASQNDEIKKLRADMAELQISFATSKRPEVDAGWSKFRPGVCGCIRKDNRKSPEYVDCPAKNFVCDAESREICEKQHPEFEC